MKKLFLISILILTLALVVSACGADPDEFEDSLDATAEAVGDQFEDGTRGGLFDDIGDDAGYILDASSEEEIDQRADEIGDDWDKKEEELEDKYDPDDTGGGDVDVDVDVDNNPGGGVPDGSEPDDLAYGICNALVKFENSVDDLFNPDLTTPEAYLVAFDTAREDFWTIREAAHGQYQAEFDGIIAAAKDFEVLLTTADDVVQRSNIVVQAGRIAYAVNALEQQINCSCTQ